MKLKKPELEKYLPASIPEARELVTEDNVVVEALEELEKYLKNLWAGNLVTVDLNPTQIRNVVEASVIYEGEVYYKANLPMFVNELIQRSYEAGNNDFSITAPFAWDYFGHSLKGTPDRRLSVSVSGEVGDYAAYQARYCNFYLDAVGVDFATGVEDIKFDVNRIYGEGRGGAESSNSTFVTRNKETWGLLLEQIPSEKDGKPSGNKIILIKDDQEEIVRNYTNPR